MSSEQKSDHSTASQEALPEFFARPVREADGPETIISPLEAINDAGQDNSGSQSQFARSSIWNRLFPPTIDDPDSQTESPNPAGMELEHFVIRERIGRGGMGIVFLAHEVALDRPVALKLLPPALAAQLLGFSSRFPENRSNFKQLLLKFWVWSAAELCKSY